MRKLYLSLLLFLGSVGMCWAQFSKTYNFRDIADFNANSFLTSDNAKYRVNIPGRSYDGWYEGGYNQGFGDDALTTRIVDLSFNGSSVKAFAFNTIEVTDSWEPYTQHVAWCRQWANNGWTIKNQCNEANVFTIPNLRAGEIVKVKMFDENRGNFNTRFIVNNSPNAAENLPWSEVNGIPGAEEMWWIQEWEQQYVMLEDGDLDLKVAGWVAIEEITIESHYTNFHQERAHVGTPISVTIPCRKFQTGNGTYRFNQIEPVVLYRGDLTPGDMTVSKTNASEQTGDTGYFTINISGFTGIQYSDGFWEGGTIIVMLDQDMYCYTVPYRVNPETTADFARWNFWQYPLVIGRSDQPAFESLLSHDIAESSFGLVYENTNNREPLFEYNGKMQGQNAYYHPETAGLIFETDGDKQYGILNDNAGNDPDGNRFIGLKNGGKLTIPELEAGDEVWVYFDHFGASSTTTHDFTSIGMKVTNATDALGIPIEDEVITVGGSTWGPTFFNSNKDAKVYVGAMHFYSTGGDMTFTPSFYTNFNFLKIAYIRIVKHNPQNIISKTNSILWYNDGGPNGGYELLTTQNAAGEYTNTYGSWGLHECGRGHANQKFQVREASGNLSAYNINSKIDNTNYQLTDGIGAYAASSGTNGKKFKYTTDAPAFGSFLLRAMDYDFNNKYCFDYADRVIAVGYRQTMNYPYTWDFTDILNSNTGNSQAEYDLSAAMSRPEGTLQPIAGIYGDTQTYNGETIYMNDTTSIWVKDADGVISLQNARISGENNRTLCSGTQLFAANTYIEEAAGLGWATINMDKGFNGSIQILDGGVKIQSYNGWETRLFVPAANKAGRLYVRGKKLNDGKGFVAKAYKNAEFGPNTFKRTPDTRVDLNALTVIQEVAPLFIYAGEFNTLFDEPLDVTEDKEYDEYMTAKATTANPMLEKLTSDLTVSNPGSVFTTADHQIVTEPKSDGQGGTIQYVTSDNGIYLNDPEEIVYDANGNPTSDFTPLYDKNVVLCDDYSDVVYSKCLETRGSGKSDARYLQIAVPAAGTYDVTIVARAPKSRQINVFAGDWGSTDNADATMIVKDNLCAKTVKNLSIDDKLTIGSSNSSVEIYAVYINEIRNSSSSTAEEDYAGYVDVAAADGGVTLYLNDIIIEKMAYSTDEKELNDIGWASESRDHYIDHSLTEYFTTNPVNAFVATGTAKDTDGIINAVSLTKLGDNSTVTVMELSEEDQAVTGDTYTGTGCILYNSNDEGVEEGLYLFVPDIHDYLDETYITNANFLGDVCTNGSPISTGSKSHANAKAAKIYGMDGNMMIANLTGQRVPYSDINATYTYYVLSYKYTDGYGNTHPADGETPEERFVRVASGGASGKANTAYLRLKTSDVKPDGWKGTAANLIILFDGEEYNDPDGINEINLSTAQGESENGTYEYYTLSGQKVNKPNKPGIYVRNGKKVYVK